MSGGGGPSDISIHCLSGTLALSTALHAVQDVYNTVYHSVLF